MPDVVCGEGGATTTTTTRVHPSNHNPGRRLLPLGHGFGDVPRCVRDDHLGKEWRFAASACRALARQGSRLPTDRCPARAPPGRSGGYSPPQQRRWSISSSGSFRRSQFGNHSSLAGGGCPPPPPPPPRPFSFSQWPSSSPLLLSPPLLSSGRCGGAQRAWCSRSQWSRLPKSWPRRRQDVLRGASTPRRPQAMGTAADAPSRARSEAAATVGALTTVAAGCAKTVGRR